MAALSDLTPDVAAQLRGAPEIEIETHLCRAAKQFCQDAGVWRVSLGTMTVMRPTDDTDRPTYVVPSADAEGPFQLPDMSFLNRIARVTLDGEEVRDFELKRPLYEYDRPTSRLIIEPGVITQSAEMEVFAVLEPTRAATDIPDWIIELHGDAITNYAIYEMMRTPDKEWSNLNIAVTFHAEYQRRVDEAREDRARGGTEGPIQLRPIPFV